MQANRLPTQRGWAWLREGLLLWRRNPALLTFLAFGYLLVLLVISIFPLIGQPIASLLMPVISLGVLNGCRAVDAGRKAAPDVLFSGFKSNVQALVTIGGLYLVATLLVLLVTSLIDGGDIPWNPSGGVLSSNPIGASGMIRFAEAARQVHGDAGDHQVTGAKLALGHAYGGGAQFYAMWVVGAEKG